MQRHHQLSVGYQALNHAGMLSEASYSLLQSYPAAGEIVQRMDEAGLFAQPVVENELLFANVIHVCKALAQTKMDKLLQLYRLLGANAQRTSLLSREAHENMLNIVTPNLLESTLQILQALPTLNRDAVARFTAVSREYAKIHAITLTFDPSQASFVYLLNAPVKRYFANQLSEILHSLALQKKLMWLDAPTFKLMIDVIASCKNNSEDDMNTCFYVVHGLSTLHSLGLFNEYHARFLKNSFVGLVFHSLEQDKLLDKETALLAFTNPFFDDAKYVCYQLGLSRKNRKEFHLGLLKDVALSEAVALLKKVVKKEHYRYDSDMKPLEQDVEQLFACRQKPVAVGTLFTPETPSLAECVSALKVKYGLDSGKCLTPHP